MLQYHMHVPGPDPLTSPDGEGRQSFYDKDVDGAARDPLQRTQENRGGHGLVAGTTPPEKYEDYLQAVGNPLLETPSMRGLTARRDPEGVEDHHRRQGRQAQRGRRGRAPFGSCWSRRPSTTRAATPPPGPPSSGRPQYPARRRQRHVTQGERRSRRRSPSMSGPCRSNSRSTSRSPSKKRPFPNEGASPRRLKKLRVVAFVQDDKTGEILQAAQVDVKGDAKEDEPKKEAPKKEAPKKEAPKKGDPEEGRSQEGRSQEGRRLIVCTSWSAATHPSSVQVSRGPPPDGKSGGAGDLDSPCLPISIDAVPPPHPFCLFCDPLGLTTVYPAPHT